MLKMRPGSRQLPRGLITGQGLLQLQKTPPQTCGVPPPKEPGNKPAACRCPHMDLARSVLGPKRRRQLVNHARAPSARAPARALADTHIHKPIAAALSGGGTEESSGARAKQSGPELVLRQRQQLHFHDRAEAQTQRGLRAKSDALFIYFQF